MQSWLEGRNWVGKGAQATGMTASLRIQSSKADSNTWESFTRSELKLESVHQESPRSDVFRKRATKPLLNQRQRQKHLTWAVEKKNWTVAQWSKVLFSDESKFCISFGNQGPRVWRKSGEAQNPCCLKSSVKFLKSVMIWGVVTSAGVGLLCFIKSKVNAAVYQEILEYFMLPSADKLYGDADFLFSAGLQHLPTVQKLLASALLTMVLLCLIGMPDLNPIWNIWDIFKRKMRKSIQQARRAEGSIVSQQSHRLIASMPHLTDAGACAKGPSTKYWVHKLTYFKELEVFCFANPFLIDLRKYSNIWLSWAVRSNQN